MCSHTRVRLLRQRIEGGRSECDGRKAAALSADERMACWLLTKAGQLVRLPHPCTRQRRRRRRQQRERRKRAPPPQGRSPCGILRSHRPRGGKPSPPPSLLTSLPSSSRAEVGTGRGGARTDRIATSSMRVTLRLSWRVRPFPRTLARGECFRRAYSLVAQGETLL